MKLINLFSIIKFLTFFEKKNQIFGFAFITTKTKLKDNFTSKGMHESVFFSLMLDFETNT